MPQQPQLSDLELRISARGERGYPVELTLNLEQEFPRGFLDPAEQPQIEPGDPLGLGEELFQWLVSDSAVRDAWAAVRGQHPRRRIRLRIDAEAPELHALPWELLRDPRPGGAETPLDLAASADTPLSRYLSGPLRPGSPVVERPLRVLVAVASPKDIEAKWHLGAIDADVELERIREATSKLSADLDLELLGSPCSLSRLEATLREGRHHVLHLVCHGMFNAEKGRGALLLADEKDSARLEPEDAVAGMLARLLAGEHPLRLVFLMSCETAQRSSADAFRGMAPALVRAGVPAVVAMQDRVPVRTANHFAGTFYRQLLDHGRVDLAVNEARSELLSGRLPPGPSLPAHAIPCLFMRLREGRLLGIRGRLSGSQREEQFWPVLLDSIADGCCIPILGPRVNEGLLPDSRSVARVLADKHGYPFLDDHDPVRVAQHVSLIDRESLRKDYLRTLTRGLVTRLGHRSSPEERRRFRRLSLTEVAEQLQWSKRVVREQETTLHHQLAELELPLYLTTNVDPLMALALRDRVPATRREGPRWTIEEGTPQWLLEPPAAPEEPVVFHLFGHDGVEEQRRHMVLSEDDHFEHLVRLSHDQQRLLPADLRESLARYTYLLLGYSITDWSFRVLLQGLLKPIDRLDAVSCHVGVQLDAEDVRDREKARDYLSRYLGQHQFTIYWGTSQQFVADLMERWRAFCEEEDDGW